MKLKNCEIGQKVKLKEGVTVAKIKEHFVDYEDWWDSAKQALDEMIGGVIGVIEDIGRDLLALSVDGKILWMYPNTVKLIKEEKQK